MVRLTLIDCSVTASERAFPKAIFVTSSRKNGQLFVEFTTFLFSKQLRFDLSERIERGNFHGFRSIEILVFLYFVEKAKDLDFALESDKSLTNPALWTLSPSTEN